MRNVFFVHQSESELSRRMEQRFILLPREAGILFVGIEVVQDPLEKTRKALFKVSIGCDRERDPSLVEAIVKKYFQGQVDETQLIIQVFRGIPRS